MIGQIQLYFKLSTISWMFIHKINVTVMNLVFMNISAKSAFYISEATSNSY